MGPSIQFGEQIASCFEATPNDGFKIKRLNKGKELVVVPKGVAKAKRCRQLLGQATSSLPPKALEFFRYRELEPHVEELERAVKRAEKNGQPALRKKRAELKDEQRRRDQDKMARHAENRRCREAFTGRTRVTFSYECQRRPGNSTRTVSPASLQTARRGGRINWATLTTDCHYLDGCLLCPEQPLPGYCQDKYGSSQWLLIDKKIETR
jgi:hypothetical protein